MANYYTDFANGSDSTGDGSWANPFKTILKGTQTISANGDEVRAKGSEWSAALSGSLTFTYNSATVTTSSDLRSQFPELTATPGNAKVVITVGDAWGENVTVLTAVAVTATTLTLYGVWVGDTGAFPVKRLETQHYYLTSAPGGGAFETVDATKINSFTGIKITGGWTADGVQGGMTAMVNAANNGTTSQYQAFGNLSSVPRQTNLAFSNFCLVNLAGFCSNQGGTQFAMHKLWMVRCSGFLAGSGVGLWQMGSNPITLYSYDSSIRDFWAVGFGGNPVQNYVIYQTGDVTNSDSKFAIAFDIKIVLQYWFRTKSTDQTLGFPNQNWAVSSYSRSINITEFYLYNSGAAGYLPINGESNTFETGYIAKLYYGGQSAVSISAMAMISGTWTIGDGTQNLANLPWVSVGTPDPTRVNIASTQNAWRIRSSGGETFRAYGFTDRGQYAHQQAFVGVSTTEYVTGTNSLVLYPGRTQSGSNTLYNIIGVVPAFNTSKTITIKMKTNGVNNSTWQTLSVWNGTSAIYANSFSATSTWTDFTFTLNPSSTNLNTTQYFTLVIYANGTTSANASRLFIDSITVS